MTGHCSSLVEIDHFRLVIGLHPKYRSPTHHHPHRISIVRQLEMNDEHSLESLLRLYQQMSYSPLSPS